MKAISLWQPWAQLIALKEKKIETRSWPTKYRGPLAIQAAVFMPKPNTIGMCVETFNAIHKALTSDVYPRGYNRDYLPRGAIVATCKLVACVRVIGNIDDEQADLENGMTVKGNEYAFGDYSLGRYAWILEDIQALPEPIPAKGMQGLWEWKEGDLK